MTHNNEDAMNAKQAKKLRKAVADIAQAAPVITFHERLMHGGIPHLHKVVDPIRYPAGSQRRAYQDMKRGRAVVVANTEARVEVAERKAA